MPALPRLHAPRGRVTYLLLIDSLDEVPTVEARRRVIDCINAFVADTRRSRVVLTSRPMAHTGVSLAECRLRLVQIAALGGQEIAQMRSRWVEAVGEDAEYNGQLTAALDELDRRHPPGETDLSILQNPLLLTCSFWIFDDDRRLPDSPAELFEQMVLRLCKARASKELPWQKRRELLELAFERIQNAGGTECDEEEVAEALKDGPAGIGRVADARIVLHQLENETGLLRFEQRRGPGGELQQIARPWHRSFEEYLCARRLAGAGGSVPRQTDKLLGTAKKPGVLLNESWEGVVTFLFGVYANRGREQAEGYVERLLRRGQDRGKPVPPRRRGRILGVAARCLAENPKTRVAPELRDELRQEIAQRFAVEGESWPLRDRLLALEALGRLGDPRLEGEPWVEIKGDSFTMGGDSEAPLSLPAQPVTVDSFQVMWRPITVQDYRPFVDDRGYKDDEWWNGGCLKSNDEGPEEWRAQLVHLNRPVTRVSWFEAIAFCRWATRKWGCEVRGCEVDLPTEAEWEFAARGPQGRVFPWGKDEPGGGDAARANYEMGHPTPVGAFPRGNWGRLADMAGNVWEWCRDEWSAHGPWKPPTSVSPRGAPRVVRGGSWHYVARNLRCACRDGDGPGDRHDYLGFRVVCRRSRQHIET